MWDSINDQSCDICEHSRNKLNRCNRNQDQYLNKENMHQSFSPAKNEDISLYETSSPPRISCEHNSPLHCPHRIGRTIEDHDTNSQDSGYGASYQTENGRFLSYTSPARGSSLSFGSGSMCSIEDEFLEDFADVEPLDKLANLPVDFNKLINDPIVNRTKSSENNRDSPKDSIIRPLFRRALSLQNTPVAPSNRVRTSLFKSTEVEVRSFKRPEPPTNIENTVIKRSKLFEELSVPVARPVLQRAISATEESIMSAVHRSSTEPDLIGDFSKNFCLPLTSSKHQDLKAITSETLARLMRGEFTDKIASYKVIDCRYPYEFDGGHIEGAINIYTKEQCLELLEKSKITAQNSSKSNILVFHCEFSSERGPNLYRYLRKEDRQRNENSYPQLNYPEIYLLEGGYKSFFHQYSEMCFPVAYKEMLHPDHEDDLRHFRKKSKTWNADTRQRPQYSRSLKRL